MKINTMLEICSEVSMQIGDSLHNQPRAESRWHLIDITNDIINQNIINDNSEDIDIIIQDYLLERGLK